MNSSVISLSARLSPSPRLFHNKCLTKLFHTVLFSKVCETASSDMHTPHMMHGLSLIIEMLNKYLHMADLSSASQVPAIVINEASVKAEGSAAARLTWTA